MKKIQLTFHQYWVNFFLQKNPKKANKRSTSYAFWVCHTIPLNKNVKSSSKKRFPRKKLTKFQIEKCKTSKAKSLENTNIMNLKKGSACEKYCSHLFLCWFIILMRKMLQIMSNKMKIVSIYTAKCEEKFNGHHFFVATSLFECCKTLEFSCDFLGVICEFMRQKYLWLKCD